MLDFMFLHYIVFYIFFPQTPEDFTLHELCLMVKYSAVMLLLSVEGQIIKLW